MSIVALAAINTLLFLAHPRALRSLRVVAFHPLFLTPLLYIPSFSFYLDSVIFDSTLSSPGVPVATVTKIVA